MRHHTKRTREIVRLEIDIMIAALEKDITYHEAPGQSTDAITRYAYIGAQHRRTLRCLRDMRATLTTPQASEEKRR